MRNLIDRKNRVIKARGKIEEVGSHFARTTSMYVEGSGRKSKLMY